MREREAKQYKRQNRENPNMSQKLQRHIEHKETSLNNLLIKTPLSKKVRHESFPN